MLFFACAVIWFGMMVTTVVINGNRPLLLLMAFLILTVVSLIGGKGLLELKSYGRTILIIFASIGLLVIPIGTVISFFILLYTGKPGIQLLFCRKNPETFTQQELQWVDEVQKTTGVKFKKLHLLKFIIVAIFTVTISVMVGIYAINKIPIALEKWRHLRQKRTEIDIQTIMYALIVYNMDNKHYPSSQSIDELSRILAYTSYDFPCKDAWGNKFRYLAWKENPQSPGADNYIIASPGEDGIWENEDLKKYTEGQVYYPDEDIVGKNGQLLRYLEYRRYD
jgi:Type II secretion system (T2SS), protein G